MNRKFSPIELSKLVSIIEKEANQSNDGPSLLDKLSFADAIKLTEAINGFLNGDKND